VTTRFVAVLERDIAYSTCRDIAIAAGVQRALRHYFLTYKQMPGERRARSDRLGLSTVSRRPGDPAHPSDYRRGFGDPQTARAQLDG